MARRNRRLRNHHKEEGQLVGAEIRVSPSSRGGARHTSSLLVSGCDKLHNARAIIGDLENPAVGISVFDRFTGGREGTLRYYESIKRILVARQMPMALVFESIVTRMHELADASDRLPLSHGVYYPKGL